MSTGPSEQRKHHSNGIWLCGTHAKLIDSDESHFTVEELFKWKRLAEQRSFLDVVLSYPNSAGPKLADDKEVQTAFDLLFDYAKSDLLAFQNMPGWPSHAISLNLRMVDEKHTRRFTASGLVSGLDVFDEVTVIAQPGTGKTTTLLQLVEAILENAHFVAVFVPLNEWSTRTDTFFQSLVRRVAFCDLTKCQFERLALHGRLVLILDGWNELDTESKRRVRTDIRSLRRDFPDIRLVVSSRYNNSEIPIKGPVVEIQLLTEGQQLEIAKALRGSEGESLIDHAWRTPGLRELIAIPLYLTALLKQTPGGFLPTTKEEVLRSFVAELEQEPDKWATLSETLQGLHRKYLEALAIEATRQKMVAISESQARAVVYTVQEQLMADKQIAQALEPMAILDTLVSAHMLVRTGGNAGGVAFQHQQFQEWFTSFEVEQLIRESGQDDANARASLRVEILNWPSWEEAILFACERLSRGGKRGQQVVAKAIILALGIDPILAAEMIYHGTTEVWSIISEDVMNFIERWHTPGVADRAVRFMITAGRPEFAPYVWPLISNANREVRTQTLDAADRFRPTVLGENPSRQLATLPEEIRKDVIPDIASNSGLDGMELATSLAIADPSPNVVIAIIRNLDFRRAERHIQQILKDAPDEIWQLVASETYVVEMTDPELNERLHEERRRIAEKETDPLRIIDRLVQESNSDNGEHIAALILNQDFPINRENSHHVIQSAFEVYPQEVAKALLRRIADGLDLPYNTTDFLGDVEPVDDGPIAGAAFDRRISKAKANAHAACAILGQNAVGCLLDQLLDLNQKFERQENLGGEEERNEFEHLRNAISKTRQSSFIGALKLRATTDQPKQIQLMADLFARHGRKYYGDSSAVISKDRNELVAMLLHWIDVMLTSSAANRHQFAHVAEAATRLADPQFVPGLQKMLDRELSDRDRAREEYLNAERRGLLVPHDVSMCYTLQYRRAFVAIGGTDVFNLMRHYLPNDQFGMDAACVLRDIWQNENRSPREYQFRLRHDFSEVKARRQERLDGTQEPRTCDFSEAIFAVVEELGTAENSASGQRHALRLAEIALSIPHGSKRAIIDRLLSLPQPFAGKQALLRSAAIAGEIVSVDLLLRGTRELLDIAQDEPWRLDHNRGELTGWIQLFAFSDRPEAVLEALEWIPEHLCRPWQLDSLLSALSHSPGDEGVQVLLKLKQRDPRFLENYNWWQALGKIGTEESSYTFLDVVCNLNRDRSLGMKEWQMSEILAEAGRRFPAFREEMVRRYESNSAGGVRNLLEVALAQIADEAIIFALIRSYASAGRTYGGWLADALRNVAVGRQPAKDWPGAFEEFSVPLTDLRKALFAMIVENNPESALAEACLTAIEAQRDWHGRIEDEPRHPDIASGKAWPLIDATSNLPN